MAIYVFSNGWDPETWRERFSRAGEGRECFIDGDTFDRESIKYAVLWQPTSEVLAGLPNLEVMFSLGAGVDHIIKVHGVRRDVPLVRIVNDSLPQRMSEYVVMHCLMYLRRHERFRQQQVKKIWDSDYQPSADEVSVGIMGLGVLGRDAAKKLKVMGFNVRGWSRTPKEMNGVETFHGQDGLDAFLAGTDILVCLLPATDETRNILNLALFEKLRRDGVLGGPFVINAGRGALQVEADIIAALDKGALKGATLDVFQTEPLPGDSPLWAHPGVTITPHNAADSAPDATCRYILGQIDRYEAGLPLENVVDFDQQY